MITLKLITGKLLLRSGAQRFWPVFLSVLSTDSDSLDFAVISILVNSLWVNLALFCALITVTYFFVFCFLFFVFCFEKLSFAAVRGRDVSVLNSTFGFIILFLILFFYEFCIFYECWISAFLRHLGCFFLLPGYLVYFFCFFTAAKKLLKLCGIKLTVFVYKVYFFFNKKINYFIIFLFILLPLLFLGDYASYERYHAATSFTSSWSVFFFVQLNTFFLFVLILTYYLLKSTEKNIDNNFLINSFFSRCIFLSALAGFISNFLLLFFLNSFFSHITENGDKLSGVIMLFKNQLRIDEANLYFMIFFSLIVLTVFLLVEILRSRLLIVFSARQFLKFNFLIIVAQNSCFILNQQYRFFLITAVVLFSGRFLVSFFVKILCELFEYFLTFFKEGGFRISCFKGAARFNGFFGIGLMDFFNWRGIIKPLNWVYTDADKSTLVAEQTTEIIVAAKLKSILGAAKTVTYLSLTGGVPLSFAAVAAVAGGLEISLTFDENLAAAFCDSAVNATWHAFQESAARELDSYFRDVINSLDQTPHDKVPLRKRDQLVLDRFDAASDEEVIRRRDLAREGWVYLAFSYVAGRLLWRLIMRWIFGGGGDDDGGGPGGGLGGGPTNDTFVSW